MVTKTLRIKAQTSEKFCRGYCCTHQKWVIAILVNRRGWNAELLTIHHYFLGQKDPQKAERSAVLWLLGDLTAIKRAEGIFENVGKHLKGGMTAFVLCSKWSDLFGTQSPALPDSVFSIMHQTGFLLTRCGFFHLACLNRTQDSGPRVSAHGWISCTASEPDRTGECGKPSSHIKQRKGDWNIHTFPEKLSAKTCDDTPAEPFFQPLGASAWAQVYEACLSNVP